MGKKDWTEKEIRDLIRIVLKDELKEISKELKVKTSKDEVKEIVRDTIVNMHKYFWQKSSTYIKQI